MNKSNSFNRKIMTVGSIVLFLYSIALGKSPSHEVIVKRIENLNTVIDLRITDEVMEQVYSLIEHRRRDAETILGRCNMFFPTIEQTIRDKNLPDELKYIAVIESSLIPFVKSRQGASGMWQFMEGTAEMYGLHIDKYIDERMDIEKSTATALVYFSALYKKYSDWTLVLAAYNCGDGTIDRAIKKTGKTNYWDLAPHLPKETQRYIPRFIAAMYLHNHYYDHDLTPRESSELLTKTATIKVTEKVDFKKLSKELELDIDYIKFLNPIWRKEVIPQKDNETYTLTLPQEMMYAYIEKFNSFDNLVTSLGPQAITNSEETIAEIAADLRQHYSIRQLRKVKNQNFTARDSFKDELLIIGLRNGMSFSEDKSTLYQLKRKETLADVARTNNMTLTKLMELNAIKDDNDINPGSIIKLSK
jgi:membrane-bound lytic murein transglycosylase D